MQVEFVAPGVKPPSGADGAFATVGFEGAPISPAATPIDESAGGTLTRAAATVGFTGAKGRNLDLVAPHGSAYARVLLIGAGEADKFDAAASETACAEAYQALKASGSETLTFGLRGFSPEHAARAALGASLAAYRFDRYKTREKPDKKPTVQTVRIETDEVEAAQRAFEPLSAAAKGVTFARDLVSEPANILYPAEFARRVKALESLGLSIEVLGEAEMKALGMGSLLGVGQGSERESQLVVIQWKGASDPNAQPIAFVGKGVCFDTGGISLKPADGMEDMKWDMGGAAAVSGLMHALATRKAKVNAVGILGLVENMPDGAAQRPGDIVTSMSGQTIEVINTDAEGRLVLADAIWYCQDRFKPKFVIDLATLTGAIIIALGNDIGGLFSNNDELAGNLLNASKASGDTLWRLPLPPAYEKQIDSMAADVKNTGGRPGGSITAALFVQRFVNDVPWAHLDIASVAWKKPSSVPTIPEGATGFGVRLLDQLVADFYEE
ncbi:MAG TPA: leucyl aminopeptidase [Caulobacteraceae bacterium]|nr:leucyl aminopeptidase [Caulobacteraceae bacterium]